MDELIPSRASSAPQPGGAPANRDPALGQVSGVSPLPEGPVPIGSLVFADELPDGVVVADEAAFSALVEVAKKALPDASGSAAA